MASGLSVRTTASSSVKVIEAFGSYNLTDTHKDILIVFATISAPLAILTLPPATSGYRRVVVKDRAATAGVYPIYVKVTGGGQIDDRTEFYITSNDASVEFYQDNGSWWTREYKRSVPNQYNSIATQTLTAINTATPVTFATTEMGSADFSHVVSSLFECENPGTYMFDAQLQVRDTSARNNTVYACYQLYDPGTGTFNGIPYASSKATLGLRTRNEEITLGLTRAIRLQKNDLVRLVFGASSTAIQLVSTSSPFVGVSDIPSATIRISRVTTNT